MAGFAKTNDISRCEYKLFFLDSDFAANTEEMLTSFTRHKETTVSYNTIDRYFLALEAFLEFLSLDRKNVANIGKCLI